MSVELVVPAENVVGESAVWDHERRQLLWVDIVGKTIHRFDPATSKTERWNTPDFVTSIGLRKDDGAIVGFTKTVCLWDYSDTFLKIADIETDMPGNRLNEGVVGPDGAFWLGTMQNNIAPDGSPLDMDEDTGRIYRLLPDGQVELMCEDMFGITNTFVWSNDNQFITADTLKNEIYRYDVSATDQTLTNQQVIIGDFERGLPDGSTIDADGYVWNCRVVDGGCLLRFSPDGKIDQIVDLPCSWPTSCAFGGENLDTLYVTSARFTMDADRLKKNPLEGGLFAVDVGVKGIACSRFG